ncbi:hypothetical protein [Sulfolobus monocaudavirus SMV3]|uniref:hypothetical protein n=1 Tax=Sulfolobus monocaudavirus SMV3 TaxID=1732177 RepID=UPI000705B767|nr:hypothetical protein AXI69_gp52 [Sulfolobus monocaudavirus SMV3]ALG96989.1 hypothetical protein [Sulfolobus monocaudavirus SMV3]
MTPLNINLNINPLTGVEIIITLLLAIATYDVYTKVKTTKTKHLHEILSLEAIAIKSTIIDMSRFALLWVAMILSLISIIWSTKLSIVFVADSLQSPLSTGIEIALFLLLFVNVTFIRYFFNKYGAVYKLPLAFLVRNNIKQFLAKRPEMVITLMAFPIAYAITIIYLLTLLINAPSLLSKEVVGIVTVLLLIEVLPNKKYDNAINLVEKIWSIRMK